MPNPRTRLSPTVTVIEDATIKGTEQRALGGGLEGAERTTRETFAWNPLLISPDAQINTIRDMADARGRDMIQNDGYATGAINTHKDSIVGAQYLLNARPHEKVLGATEGWAEEFQEVVEARFNLMMESTANWIDAGRTMTFTGLVRLAVGGYLMTGEVLAAAEWIKTRGVGLQRPFSTAIQMIAPIRLSNPDGETDNRFLRKGVRLDAYGAPLAYCIRKSHPWDVGDPSAFEWREVPTFKPWGRRQIIHIIEPLQPDQTRGISDMVSVLKNMRMTKTFKDVVLQNAVVNASYAAAIESELPSEAVFASMGAGQPGLGALLGDYMTALTKYTSAAENIKVDGVKMPHLFPGTKLALKPMGTPGGVGTEFEDSLLRHTAAALGLSYEEFSRDYRKTNYSSARASGASTWKYMAAKKKTVADRFAKNIYELVLEEEINAGNVPAPKGGWDFFYNDPVKREALLNCTFIGASRGQIDEMKETQSAILRIQNGLSTVEDEAARLGLDYRVVYKQLAREKKMRKALGLDEPVGNANKPAANGNQQQSNSANQAQEEEEL